MNGLVNDAGRWRRTGVGVMAGDQVIHMAPPASRVPQLISQLLRWLATTDAHPPQVTPQVARLLLAMREEMTRGETQAALQLQDRKSFSARYLQPALLAKLIEMTLPDKPNSRLQQYRLTDRGRRWLKRQR